MPLTDYTPEEQRKILRLQMRACFASAASAPEGDLPSPELHGMRETDATTTEPAAGRADVLSEVQQDQVAMVRKTCGCPKTVWCACTKFRDYYDSEHDGDTPDPVSN